MLNATFNKSQMDEIRRVFKDYRKKGPRILADAANETTKTVNSRITKSVDLNLPQKMIRPPRAGGKNDVSGWRFRKATPQNPSAQIVLPSKRISLIHFKPKDTKKRGVRVKVFKGKPATVWRHAFIARAKNAQQVWQRKREGGKPSGRLPIQKLAGPSLQHVIEKNLSKFQEVTSDVQELLATRVAQQIQRQVIKGK